MLERVLFRSDLCKACRRCEMACIAAHNGIEIKEAMKRRAEFVSRVRVVKGEDFKTTVRCHECENAPCCHICPTGALSQLESGEVVMHPELCIACEMCADACPYGAIQMETTTLPAVKIECTEEELKMPRKVAVRCNMCRDLRAESGKLFTPCMEACPVQAIGILTEDGKEVFPEKPVKKPAAAKAPAAKAQAE
jgi:anaerobic carbon-monoxide dehydrogenase iron sulfur subunit